MAAVVNPVQITASDRLGFSIFFAAVLHAIIILGLGFGYTLNRDTDQASILEITMVLTKTHQAPEEAKRIASENQLASGSTDKENQPTAPFVGTSLLNTTGVAPEQRNSSIKVEPKFKVDQEHVLTHKSAQPKVKLDEPRENINESVPRRQELKTQQQLELAKLVAELQKEQQDYAKRPRINYIDTLSAKSAVEASYVREWVEKVERIGNLNYPDEARNKHLTGTLILSVLLNHDGKVLDIEIKSSTGKSILDEAAKRIVRIASPFKPFPQEMLDNYDQLMVTRTWLFGKENKLLTK